MPRHQDLLGLKQRANMFGEGEPMESEFAERDRSELDRLRTLSASLSDDALRRPIDSVWSAAALFAHLAFWDGSVVLDGCTPPGPEGELLLRSKMTCLNSSMTPTCRTGLRFRRASPSRNAWKQLKRLTL